MISDSPTRADTQESPVASASPLLEQLPLPKPDLHAYESELEAALASSRECRENYDKFRQSKRTGILDYSPVKMDIENVSRCNFRCAKCQVSSWKGFRRAADMALDEYERLIDSLYGLVEIKLQGMGEPLLAGESFFNMIEYARRRHIWVRTTTNASLLHVKDNYKRLIDADPSEVQISVDGTRKETFETIRRGSDFDVVVRNCKSINQYCNSRGLLKTRMWVCLQRHNFGEFRDFVSFAHELGFKRLSFALNLHGWGLEEYAADNSKLAVDDDLTLDLASEAVHIGRNLGVDVSFWNNISKYDAGSEDTLCPWPFERAFVSSDMRIVPCCMIGNPDTADMGDARLFAAHWHDESYQEFRWAHMTGRIPKVCRGCYGNAI